MATHPWKYAKDGVGIQYIHREHMMVEHVFLAYLSRTLRSTTVVCPYQINLDLITFSVRKEHSNEATARVVDFSVDFNHRLEEQARDAEFAEYLKRYEESPKGKRFVIVFCRQTTAKADHKPVENILKHASILLLDMESRCCFFVDPANFESHPNSNVSYGDTQEYIRIRTELCAMTLKKRVLDTVTGTRRPLCAKMINLGPKMYNVNKFFNLCRPEDDPGHYCILASTYITQALVLYWPLLMSGPAFDKRSVEANAYALVVHFACESFSITYPFTADYLSESSVVKQFSEDEGIMRMAVGLKQIEALLQQNAMRHRAYGRNCIDEGYPWKRLMGFASYVMTTFLDEQFKRPEVAEEVPDRVLEMWRMGRSKLHQAGMLLQWNANTEVTAAFYQIFKATIEEQERDESKSKRQRRIILD